MNLGELLLRQKRWPELDQAVQGLRQKAHAASQADLLRTRGQLARGELAAAKATVQAVLREKPDWVPALLLFSRVLIEEGQDWEGVEKMLRRVLQLQPNQREAEHNLKVLLLRKANRGTG